MINKLPVVVGVEIPLDEFGRYNLNTLHKASGEGEHKRPSKWLDTKQAKELISELEYKLLKNNQSPNSGFAQKVVESAHGGTSPGTYAHELIAVSYAGWIRADFQLDVNQAFIDFKSGSSHISLENMPSLAHLTGRFQELRNIVSRDEQQEAELLTICSLIMNGRKKTKGKRQLMIEALDKAGQVSMVLKGGGK
ncbi:KilA-N domain-containing protein [Pantoea sp. JZ2]|nr:KilA-N domain-containing protein [Pantoea sp. JZ2]WRH14992.1 KilA-N domain-containing protein [Pantoea sp. JZ2]